MAAAMTLRLDLFERKACKMSDKPKVTPLEKDLVDALKEKEQEGISFLKIESGTEPKQGA